MILYFTRDNIRSGTNMPEIKKKSLVDQIYEQLRKEIIYMRRPLGSKLSVAELQAELGVSCTPIREAINRLQQEGLVLYKNNTGASILTLTAHDAVEIQQVALALHCEAIRLAMEHTEHDYLASELDKRLNDYMNAESPKDDVTAVNKFLAVFYHNCGNSRLDKSMLAIQGQQLLLRNIYASGIERGRDAEYFRGIVDSVKSADEGTAQRYMRMYGEQMTKELVSIIE